MAESVALVTVASESYRGFAENLMDSAREFFRPTEPRGLTFEILEGEEGWPRGTMCRHSVLLSHLPRAYYVFLIDADMLFADFVGPEILPKMYGITATLHPGFVGRTKGELPFERNPESAAYVHPDAGEAYYCGGFVGGERLAMRMLSGSVEATLERDALNGIVPCWHDESAVNRFLVDNPPEVVLHPGYCNPDDDHWYRSWWPEQWSRRIVALDKTPAERVGR